MLQGLKWFIFIFFGIISVLFGVVAGTAAIVFLYEGSSLHVFAYEWVLPFLVGGGLFLLLKRVSRRSRRFILAERRSSTND